MNEHTKQAALEAFRKEGEYINSSSTQDVWFTACEWMHEYATQAAYKRAMQHSEWLARPLRPSDLITLANESGKGEKG